MGHVSRIGVRDSLTNSLVGYLVDSLTHSLIDFLSLRIFRNLSSSVQGSLNLWAQKYDSQCDLQILHRSKDNSCYDNYVRIGSTDSDMPNMETTHYLM